MPMNHETGADHCRYGAALCGYHLRYRDDLRDGGAQHFADCITAIGKKARKSKLKLWCRISVVV